jgi:hypothetical protein
MRLGRHTEALADFEEVIELAHGFKRYEMFRAFHALTKARLGDLSALAGLGDQVRDVLKVAGPEGQMVYQYWMLYYDAACRHAALAKLALEGQGRPPAERQRLAQRDLDAALDLLDRAREIGDFKGEIRLDEIRREPTLDPSRSHPRFQLLMMDLAFPDDPFQP